jgi:hypothetical protein
VLSLADITIRRTVMDEGCPRRSCHERSMADYDLVIRCLLDQLDVRLPK